jgi:hypothetical protein
VSDARDACRHTARGDVSCSPSGMQHRNAARSRVRSCRRATRSRSLTSAYQLILQENQQTPWHLNCTPDPATSEEIVQDSGTGGEGVRERLERIMSAYEDIDRRFIGAGGLGSVLNLYEQIKRELERVSFEELDRMTLEIKTVIEALLKMDYELRKVHNLKLAFETRSQGSGTTG